MRQPSLTYELTKRAIDVVVSALGLVLLSPMLACVALVVAFGLGRPVLFRQTRAGRGGKPFEVVKFRSMLNVDPGRGLVTDAERLTPLGQFLRSTSLDELPSLWNVLRGEMSLVGPRPLPVRYLARYTKEQARRHDVRPGVTGLAQVGGRNELNWDTKFSLDLHYVSSRSTRLDLRILLDTFKAVARRSGISPSGNVTAPEFLGGSSSLQFNRTTDQRAGG